MDFRTLPPFWSSSDRVSSTDPAPEAKRSMDALIEAFSYLESNSVRMKKSWSLFSGNAIRVTSLKIPGDVSGPNSVYEGRGLPDSHH